MCKMGMDDIGEYPVREEVMEDRVILEGCEVGCITVESGLIACPLSKEEASKCPRRLGYQAGIREVVEWINKCGLKTMHFSVESDRDDIVIPRNRWQAKLKEWGLK